MYLPSSKQDVGAFLNKLYPYVFDVHGGAFKMGDKAPRAGVMSDVISSAILDKGIAIVRVNYRLVDEAIWPAQQEDILSAVQFVQGQGASLGLDATRMALWGKSAGAFLAVSTAVKLAVTGGPPRAVIDFYGPMDFGSMDADDARTPRSTLLGMRRAVVRAVLTGDSDGPGSPESKLIGKPVGENREAATALCPVGVLQTAGSVRLPPIMIRHGDADCLISHLQAERLREAWVAADDAAKVDYATVPDHGHGGGDFADRLLDEAAEFLCAHLL